MFPAAVPAPWSRTPGTIVLFLNPNKLTSTAPCKKIVQQAIPNLKPGGFC